MHKKNSKPRKCLFDWSKALLNCHCQAPYEIISNEMKFDRTESYIVFGLHYFVPWKRHCFFSTFHQTLLSFFTKHQHLRVSIWCVRSLYLQIKEKKNNHCSVLYLCFTIVCWCERVIIIHFYAKTKKILVRSFVLFCWPFTVFFALDMVFAWKMFWILLWLAFYCNYFWMRLLFFTLWRRA